MMVTNRGPDSADAVVADIVIPTTLAYVSDTCGAGEVSPGNWRWSIGTLVPNATSRVRPRCVVTFTGASPGSQSIDSSVSSSMDDPSAANNATVTAISVN